MQQQADEMLIWQMNGGWIIDKNRYWLLVI
jgi:hypothetical protein